MSIGNKFQICPICKAKLAQKSKKCLSCNSSLYQYEEIYVSQDEYDQIQSIKEAKNNEPSPIIEVVNTDANSTSKAQETTPFLTLRFIRAIFGIIAIWQILTLVPAITWILRPSEISDYMLVGIVVKILVFAITFYIFNAIGNYIKGKHLTKHGTPHPSLIKLFSL